MPVSILVDPINKNIQLCWDLNYEMSEYLSTISGELISAISQAHCMLRIVGLNDQEATL
jgi:hypothetical protein